MIWFLLAPLSISLTLLAFLLAPILPLFADKYGWLPVWLWWFQTPDNSLDGDHGWKAEHCLGWPRYLKRVAWLIRNPAYGFEIEVCGAVIFPADTVNIWGNPRIKNRTDGVAGWYCCLVGDYWNFKAVLPMGSRCLQFEYGWKLQPYAQNGAPKHIERAQLVGALIIPRVTAFT